MKVMEENALKAANFLKGIASQHRLVILCQLAEGEKSVTQLIEATSLPQTSMSQHLSKLKEENIVTFRRDHRTLYYSIKNEAILKIMDVLYHEFC
ncbi:metalloregulator ArsR/SmtB family transcription factor [Pseudomonadota bacterium]|jgi:DNA-binding transcriptional ArsR family regulator|nr:metalloregulator ArsR/SmtB family transcription factor [Pseudomonadota bacterium]|tara:strand:- start:4072 stop:4356 length:285 start_codon:yes stop_codon:yes gene_type:complete